MTTWTAEMVATLRSLWPDRDIPVSDIAGRLGVSLGAAYGKANELGLRRYAPRGAGATATKARRRPVEPVRLAAAPSAFPAPPAPVVAPLPGERAAPPRRCAWPAWGWGERPGPAPRFCGSAVVGGGSYCAEHAALAIRRRGEPYRKLPPPTLLGRLLLAA